MARSHINDFLSVGRFHLLDVSFSIPFVLLPVFGFRSATLPELSVDIYKIKEGNYEYPRKVVKGAEIGPVTLEQGVQLINSDFWDWTRKAVKGRVPPKNLLLVQFTRIAAGTGNGLGSGAPLTGGSLGGNAGIAFSNTEFAVRLPGRAWLFKECRPARYKPGSDFDGMSQDISIAQLDLEMEEFEEYSLGI